MITCLGENCGAKTYATLRAVKYQMCERCLELALQDIKDLKKPRRVSILPVLFYADLKMIVERLGIKAASAMLNLQPVTLRSVMRHKGRKRLPGWLVRAVYRPLWGRWGDDWLAILPMRVLLVAANERRRRFRKKSLPVDLSISPVDCSSLQRSRGGLPAMLER